jgi:hypothetical protein
MRTLPCILGLLATGLAAVPLEVRADAPAAPQEPIEQVCAKLKPEVAAGARKWLHDDPRELKALLALSPAALQDEVIFQIASDPGAADFILGRLPLEPDATKQKILKLMVFDPVWVEHPGTVEALGRLAETAADPQLMLDYLNAERRIEVKRLRLVLTARIEAARKSGDSKELELLAAADERWNLVERGASMPGFMRRVPPVFEAKPAGGTVRAIGTGDFGTGTASQRDVAAAMVRMGAAKPFDIGITLGDNFYPSGMTGTDDPRWRDWWETLYGPLGITFYPTLGNHEWYSDDGAAAEIAYRSPTWRFPSPYYSYTAGPVQFFALDTTDISEAELLWLDKAISASTARWKVVYGHHPIFAPESNARAGLYMKFTQARLWPVIRGRVDAYLSAHAHAMAHMQSREGVHFFMSGGGGGPLTSVSKTAPGAIFAESNFGFLTLDADAARMTIAIYDKDGKAYDSETVVK